MPLRWRLLLWQVILLAITLIGFAVLSYRFLTDGLAQEVDKNLRERAQHVLDAIQVLPSRGTAAISTPTDEFATPGIYVQVLTLDRLVIAHSANLAQQQLPIAIQPFTQALAGQPMYTTELVGEQQVRFYYQVVQRAGSTLGVVQVGQSLSGVASTMRRLQLIYLVGIAVALGMGGVISGLLVRLGLKPVRQVAQLADHIAQSGNVQERLAYQGPQDEIGQLATTFNQMMIRLDAAFTAQQRLIADTAHELRTPLATMLGNLELLDRYGADAERRHLALRAIKREGERTTRLVANLLLLAQADAGQQLNLSPVALDEVVLEVYEQAAELRHGAPVTLEQCQAAMVSGDRDRLIQMLTNLIDNARKYTPLDGRVSLWLTCHERQACITVSDTGAGIASGDLPHIFDRFYRGNQKPGARNPSAGLGLAIVKWIVEEHSGTIVAASEAQQGATFTIQLPTCD